jgi:hypothetical protein
MEPEFTNPGIRLTIRDDGVYMATTNLSGVLHIDTEDLDFDAIDYEYNGKSCFSKNTRELIRRGFHDLVLKISGKKLTWLSTGALVEYISLAQEAFEHEAYQHESESEQLTAVIIDICYCYSPTMPAVDSTT